MRRMMVIGLALIVATTFLGPSLPASAEDGPVECPEYSTGRLTPATATQSLTATAPSGKLISAFCVRTGTGAVLKSPAIAELGEPSKSVTIASDADGIIFNYSVKYIDGGAECDASSLIQPGCGSLNATPAPVATSTPSPTMTATSRCPRTQHWGARPCGPWGWLTWCFWFSTCRATPPMALPGQTAEPVEPEPSNTGAAADAVTAEPHDSQVGDAGTGDAGTDNAGAEPTIELEPEQSDASSEADETTSVVPLDAEETADTLMPTAVSQQVFLDQEATTPFRAPITPVADSWVTKPEPTVTLPAPGADREDGEAETTITLPQPSTSATPKKTVTTTPGSSASAHQSPSGSSSQTRSSSPEQSAGATPSAAVTKPPKLTGASALAITGAQIGLISGVAAVLTAVGACLILARRRA